MQPKEDDIAALYKLQQRIASLDFSRDDLTTDHKDIYNYIEKTIIEPKSTVLEFLPPADVLAYVAKNILFPTFAHKLTPHLLDVIATVEFYRQNIVSQGKKALHDRKAAGGLANDEEAYLRKQVSLDKNWRQVYLTILGECCHYDLYDLWLAYPPSMGTFMIRFNEYFPFLNKYCTHPSPRLFHQTLSKDEQETLGKKGLAVCDFCSNSESWIAERVTDRAYWTLFQAKEFREMFPPPCTRKKLVKLICSYLDYVVSLQTIDGMLN
ncbi:hypothetical protein JOM56_001967 [Amanita muscaria]